MNAPRISKADRDQLDDHDVPALDHRVGLPPHAEYIEEVLAQ